MPLLARRAQRKAPARLVSMTLSNSSSLIRMSSWSRGDAGVGHEDLHRAAEQLLGLGEGRVDRGGVGHLADDALQPLGRLPRAVGDDDLVAGLGEGPGDAQPDAPVASGDQHVAACHASPLSRRVPAARRAGPVVTLADYRSVRRHRTRLIVEAWPTPTTMRHDGPVVQSVTSAPESLADEQAARIRRYLFTMGIRTTCFVLRGGDQRLGALDVCRAGCGAAVHRRRARQRGAPPDRWPFRDGAARPRPHQADRALMQALVCSAKGCRSAPRPGRTCGTTPSCTPPTAARSGWRARTTGSASASSSRCAASSSRRCPPRRSPRPLAETRRAGLDPAGPPS